MEIVDRRSSDTRKQFKTLNFGDVFEEGTDIYMKCSHGSAFWFKENRVIEVWTERRVIPVKATLTIERLT